MISLSEKSKETASSLLNLLSTSSEKADAFTDATPNVEILGNIYKLMVKKAAFDKTQDELDDDRNDARHHTANKRHQEILEALSFKPKVKELEPVKPEEPKVETPKAEKPKVNKVKGKKLKKVPKTKKTVTKEKKTVTEKPTIPPVVEATPVLPTAGTVAKVAVATGVVGVSTGALAKIKGSEGFSEKAYYDPKRSTNEAFYSIGFGHQITNQEVSQGFIKVGEKKIPVVGDRGKNTVISREDAEVLVKQDYEKYDKYARSLPNFDRLNPEAQMALIDMSYNMGVGWAKNWTKFRQQLENLDLQGASNNIRSSLYATQVGKRAQDNANAIQNGLKPTETKPSTLPTKNTIGTTIDNTSKENKQLQQEMNETPVGSTVINNTNISSTQTQQQRPTEVSDDKSAYERKSRIK